MEIGTAKPSLSELNEIKHHFINCNSITDHITVGDYEKAGLKALEKIFGKSDVAILAGGSGLFLNAICEGFDEFPEIKPGIREDLNQTLADFGIITLQSQLKVLDPVYYAEVDIHNPHRVVRGLEVCISSGKAYSSFRLKNRSTRSFNTVKICLNIAREQLYKQINHRVDNMMEAGLLGEVKDLVEYRHLNALNTVGYTELFNYLDGTHTLQQAIDSIKQNTRRFAKRQLTWFRKDPELIWLEPDTDQVLKYLNSKIKI